MSMSVWVVGYHWLGHGREKEAVICRNDFDENHAEEERVYVLNYKMFHQITYNNMFHNFGC